VTELSVTLREWQSLGPDDDGQGALLRGFRFSDAQDRQLAEALTKSRVLELRELYNGLYIRSRSHVGRIQLGNLTVTIVPKIAVDELLTLFRYAYGLRDLKRFAAAGYAVDGDLFQDLIIAQLCEQVRELLDRGIARDYVPVQENLASPRGRIDFLTLAARSTGGSATLPCQHYPRSGDHLLNQVVLAGLGLAHRIAEDRALASSVGRQRKRLAEYARPVRLSSAILDQAKRALNRLVAPYEYVLRLIEILHRGSLVDLNDDVDRAHPLPGFLFDMNRFFQALLERFLSENLPGLHVQREYGLAEMMRYLPGHNPRQRRSPKPRPDYAITGTGRGRAPSLLDAKYRDLWEQPLPRDMLYQLSVYALSQPRGSTSAILYPTTDDAARSSRIEIREPLTGGSAGFVALRPVKLRRLVELIEADGVRGQTQREETARELVGVVN
jgi:5-methylcytosine-specific restriction enzyme subunit McrC